MAGNGQVLLKWTVRSANYTAVWANPFWDLLDRDPAASTGLIHDMLEAQFSEMQPPPAIGATVQPPPGR